MDTRTPGKKSPVPAEIVRLPFDGAVQVHQTVCPPPIATSPGSNVAPTSDAEMRIAVPFRATRARLTQEKLAEQADLHPVYVGEVERGEQTVSVHALMRLANALGVRVRDLGWWKITIIAN